MVEFEVVMDKLNGFKTADEIAEYFRDYGIKAVPGDVQTCAISKFVKQETGISSVHTGASIIRVVPGQDPSSGRVIGPYDMITNLSEAAKQFVVSFDLGNYPDLIKQKD